MNINFELFDAIYILAGFVLGVIFCSFIISKLKKEIKMLKRQYEKKSIGADDSSLKVKTLIKSELKSFSFNWNSIFLFVLGWEKEI